MKVIITLEDIPGTERADMTVHFGSPGDEFDPSSCACRLASRIVDFAIECGDGKRMIVTSPTGEVQEIDLPTRSGGA